MDEKKPQFDPVAFLAEAGPGRTILLYRRNHVVFSQGDHADAVFYIQQGIVKLAVLSTQGKEAVIAMLGAHDFFGEGCLADRPLRMATASAMADCSLVRVSKEAIIHVLHAEPSFSQLFLTHVLSRNIRIEDDLVDHLFNSSEKRLARILLLLANFGKEEKQERIIPKISQETLAEMVGTTRPRVSYFMNKFRRLGFIDYKDRLKVHSSLQHVILRD